jgi:hypothetical protein
VELDRIDDIWGAVDPIHWRSTPCVQGRPATEEDVCEGRAVFYVDGPSTAIAMPLPHCAYFQDEGGSAVPVVVIQAETQDGTKVLIGYRPLSGGNGICTFDEIQLLRDFGEISAIDCS